MEGMMKGLFGGGADDDAKVSRAKDFAQRYTHGDPSTGYDEDEALTHFNDVIAHSNSDEVERATKKTLENLPASDRAQFGDFVSQLKQRDPGASPSSGGSGGLGVDDISKMFGQSGGKANNAQDMFGSLFGGSGGSSGGGGLGGMLGGLMGGGSSSGSGGGLGGLLGGGSGSGGSLRGLMGGGSSSQAGGMGGMLGGNLGKMILGGIAAYLIKDKLG